MKSTDIIAASRDVFMETGPLRIGVLLLAIVQKSLRAKETVIVPDTQLEDARTRIIKAFNIISHGVPQTLEDNDIQMPPDLKDLQTATCDAMRPIVNLCTAHKVKNGSFLRAIEHFDALEHSCVTKILPLSTEFIHTFMALMDSAGEKALKREKAKSANSLDEVADVGMRIQMVAVNASIEAARAGDFGKGFSVIAAETKMLAKSMTTVLGEISEDLRRV